MVQSVSERVLFIDGDNLALCFEVFCGGNLVIVALFTELRAAGHNDNWFAQFEGRNDRSNPRMSDDQASLLHKFFEV